MKKVVYFDESSALDLIDIKNEGRAEEIMENIVKKAGKFSIDGGFGTGWLDNFTTGFTGGTRIGFSRKKSNIIQTNITNTILTSFLKLIKEPIKNKKEDLNLSKISAKYIYISKESAAYIKAIAPFIKILKEDSNIIKDVKDLDGVDIHGMDEILEDAKGYYELVAIDENHNKKIVRFNLDGFRNNYRLQDLQKMNLTLYGVKVGETSEKALSFINEIETNKKVENNQTNLGFDAFQDEKSNAKENNEVILDIIDIILAGIE